MTFKDIVIIATVSQILVEFAFHHPFLFLSAPYLITLVVFIKNIF